MAEPDRRVRHPKVKTGCITCRNRRVKCDETRPACKRCQKYGTQCKGYLPGRKQPPSSIYGSFASQARALVPKNQTSALILPQPNISLFETDQEYRYFRLFSDRIATEIVPYFNSEPWRRMLLQACMSEPSTRRAAVAIGALGRMTEVARKGCPPRRVENYMLNSDGRSPPGHSAELGTVSGHVGTGELVTSASTHHQNALVQHDKAIKENKLNILNGTQSLRTTLINCIIIVCFEACHGNHESAGRQLQTGLALLQAEMAKQADKEKHPHGFSSPAPDLVDDTLVQAFGRMEIQVMSVFDTRPKAIHQVLKTEGRQTVQKMPTRFENIEQARIYLDLITRRVMHFGSTIHDPPCADLPPPPDSNPVEAWVSGRNGQPIPWIDVKIPAVETQRVLAASSPSLLNEQASLSQELTSWNDAFLPLLASVPNGHQENISTLSMSISSVSSQISLRSVFFVTETAYDVFMPEFKLIVTHSASLLSLQQQRLRTVTSEDASTESAGSIGEPVIPFTFDIGVIPPLYLVVIKCRNRYLRRQALQLLELHPRREGVWDSVATVELGKWVIALEEEGARARSQPRSGSYESSGAESMSSTFTTLGHGEEDLFIPEEMRVRKAMMRFDLLEKKADFLCEVLDPETGVIVKKGCKKTWEGRITG